MGMGFQAAKYIQQGQPLFSQAGGFDGSGISHFTHHEAVSPGVCLQQFEALAAFYGDTEQTVGQLIPV